MTPEDVRFHCARFARLDERHRARARSAGRRVERVDLSWIFEQAGWTCVFCGEPIDPSLRWQPLPVSAPPDVDRRTALGRQAWQSARRSQTAARREAVANNARMPAVDHVIPRWRRGDHVAGNCRPAHYGCNGRDVGGWPPPAERTGVGRTGSPIET
jgi:hypothetical protein